MQKIIAYVLLVLVGLTSCALPPTGQPPQATQPPQPPAFDQLGVDPGGTTIVYSPDGPPIVETITSLSYHDRYVRVSYRDNMETLPGQIRINIFRILYYQEVKTDLKIVGLPKGITSTNNSSSPFTATQVISFNVSSDVQPGQYDFKVDVIIDGDDFGTLPCTIKVLQ